MELNTQEIGEAILHYEYEGPEQTIQAPDGWQVAYFDDKQQLNFEPISAFNIVSIDRGLARLDPCNAAIRVLQDNCDDDWAIVYPDGSVASARGIEKFETLKQWLEDQREMLGRR